MDGFEVDESEKITVAALGLELSSNRFKMFSFEFLLTNFFSKRSNTALFTTAVKIEF